MGGTGALCVPCVICAVWGGGLERNWKELNGALDAWILLEDEDVLFLNPLSAFKNFSIYFQTLPAPLKSCQSKLCGKIYRECLCHSSALEIKLISNRTGWKTRILTRKQVC